MRKILGCLFLLLLAFPAHAERATVTLSASFVRPSDSNAYTSGDLVANSTTTASVVPMNFTVNPTGTPIYIRRAIILKSSTGVSAPQFRLHLFNVSPSTSVGDNGVYSSSIGGWFCDIDVNMFTTTPFSNGDGGIGAPNTGGECAVVPTTNGFFGLLEARGAYTPSSAESFTVNLEAYFP